MRLSRRHPRRDEYQRLRAESIALAVAARPVAMTRALACATGILPLDEQPTHPDQELREPLRDRFRTLLVP